MMTAGGGNGRGLTRRAGDLPHHLYPRPQRAAKDRYVVVAIYRDTGAAERILNADSLGYAERAREVYQNDRVKVVIVDMEEG